MAVLAPMPSASERIATAANPGLETGNNRGVAWRRSFSSTDAKHSLALVEPGSCGLWRWREQRLQLRDKRTVVEFRFQERAGLGIIHTVAAQLVVAVGEVLRQLFDHRGFSCGVHLQPRDRGANLQCPVKHARLAVMRSIALTNSARGRAALLLENRLAPAAL